MSSDATKPSRQDQAAMWFAAERAGMMLVEQRAEFEAWKADPRNLAALDAMRSLWEDLAVLKGSEPAPQKKKPPSWLPTAAAAAGVIAVLTAGLFVATLARQPAETPIVTAEGKQETQSMPDGSVIAVNVASNVRYKFTDSERLVTLSDGEAAFFVKPDSSKPFIVLVGDLEVRALGTAFNVRQRDGVVQVSVSEGHVQICRAEQANGDVIADVSAGQLVEVAGTAGSRVVRNVVPILPSQVAEWRIRVVTYEDTTVRAVVEDFNRYFDRDLEVLAPELVNQRVTVRLQMENRDQAMETLAALLDSRIERRASGDRLSP